MSLLSQTVHCRYYTNPDVDSEVNESIQPLTLDELTLDPSDDASTDSIGFERSHRHQGTRPSSRGYQSYSKSGSYVSYIDW